MKKILRYLRPYAFIMTVGFIIKIAGTLAELALPKTMTYIIRSVVPKQSTTEIILWGLIMMLFAVACLVFNVTANRMAAKVARNAAEGIRKDLFEKTMSLSPAQTDRFTIPSLESRLTTDTYNVHHFINMIQRMGVRAPILLVGGICISLTLDPILTLVMVCVLPCIALVVYFVSKRGVPLYTKVQKKVDRMVGVVREDVQGIRVIKALSKGEYERERYDKVNRDLSETEKKASIAMALTNPLMTFFMNIGLSCVILVGAFRVNNDLSDAANILAFIQYFTLISNAMMSITRIFVMYTKGSASAERIAEVLDTPEDLTVISGEAKTGSGRDGKDNGDNSFIEFKDVCFSYNKKKNNLTNINFSIRRGGSLGIIGATGSGKTTIISLLMRFYDADSGRILIDGRDVRTIGKSELGGKFGVAMQNDFLYADTIEENIRFGRDLPGGHDDIVRAAKMAQAHDFITAFPEGYEHMLAPKGTNISGGQKQRILIARALAARPEILVLDDSSSALDYKTDASLRRAINSSDTPMTLVVVAQRVSSVMNLDNILVIDDGEEVALGTHDELIKSCEIYREISESQLGGALVE